jgi:hypothetical protein
VIQVITIKTKELDENLPNGVDTSISKSSGGFESNLATCLKLLNNLKLYMETLREKQIRETNESSRISNMTPLWKDRHNRRHGGISKYDNSLKGRQEFINMMSKD